MKKKFYIFISLVLCLMYMFFSSNGTIANASTYSSDYTDVFDDLLNDENFNISDYPSLSVDDVKNSETQTTLEIIQIAESSSKELYLYVYQPLNKDLFFAATAISMSCDYSSNGEDLYPIIYYLELVSSYDVFCKYVVKDFVVSDEPYRYYNIVCIYRNYDYTFDSKVSGTEDDGNEKAINVGQQWCCYYYNDKLVYEMGTFKTLEIKVKYTGNVEFSSGIKFGNLLGSYKYGQSWFICFDLVDYIATHIYDADMVYKIRDASRSVGLGLSGEWNYSDDWSDDIYVTLTDEDTVSYDGGGWLSKEYRWNRIMTSADFIENAENQGITISDDVKSDINDSQWVFSFCETELSLITGYGTTVYFGYDIADVTILRIHFLDVNNKIYNLGVVSDRVNPDNKSDGYGGLDEDFFEDWFQKIGMLIGLVVLLILLICCAPIVSIVLRVIFTVVQMFFKGVFVIISLPFKLIGKLFKTKNKKP